VSTPDCDAVLEQQIKQLGDLLNRHAEFWRPQAFIYLQMPWEERFPALAQCLRGLSLEQMDFFSKDADALANFLYEFIPDSIEILRAATVPIFAPLQADIAVEAARDVPGRKWQQITEFAAALPVDAHTIVEWCAGKAHLGRLLARTRSCVVTALEWNAELVADGQRLAQRESLPIAFYCTDVMSAEAVAYIHTDDCVVALHACGDLHTQLLRASAARKPNMLLLVPCCYHLTKEKNYQALSQCGASAALVLSRDDLRTAVQGTVTSPLRVQQQRKQLQAWRLGFDLLQRTLRGVDAYLPTPSQPLSILRADFPTFCRRLAELNGFSLPAQLDYAHYESAGRERLRQVTALDLPRLLFRRALEVWLVLDRALFLRESGYVVEVGTFCANELTPRNLLIRARRRTVAA
jgi:hypothetical protein